MTKKEIREFIKQLWYECNNYNWYIYKVELMEETDTLTAVNVYKERLVRRGAAVDALVELGRVLGFEVSFEGYKGAKNVLYVRYGHDIYMLWCLEYREKLQDDAYNNFRFRVDMYKPTYYSSSFIKFEEV